MGGGGGGGGGGKREREMGKGNNIPNINLHASTMLYIHHFVSGLGKTASYLKHLVPIYP